MTRLRGTGSLSTPSTQGRASHESAEGKAAQRARNKAAGNVTSSGSSGAAKRASQIQGMDWEDIAHLVEHICDIGGKMNTVQSTAAGAIMGTIYTSQEYAHALLEAQLASQGAEATFIRVYRVPLAALMGGQS